MNDCNHQGCCYRDHVLNTKTPYDGEILRIWNLLKNVLNTEPPPITSNQKYVRSSGKDFGEGKVLPAKEEFWWCGVKLIPNNKSYGFLNKMWDEKKKSDINNDNNNNNPLKIFSDTITKIET